MKQQKLSGFTLIELLVVIAIIGILSSLVIVSMNSQRTLKDVESATQIVASTIREAQNLALTGQQFVAGTTPCYYSVVFGGSTADIKYVSRNSGGECSTPAVDVLSKSLPSGVSVSATDSPQFSLPHGTLFPPQAITVTIRKNSATRLVCIRVTGLIEEKTGSNC